jgi:predicted DNA-binding transcriptional regulator YafY
VPQDRDSRSRVLRLEALKSLLAQRDYTTAAELATELTVSVRTLNRDLATLRDMGMPIDSDRGRGGGLRLEQGWSLGRVHLNETEAIAVLLALTIVDKVGSPLLPGDVRVLARKIGSAFAPAQSRRILALRHRILVGELASPAVLNSYGAANPVWAQALLRAFLQSEVAEITYRDQHGTETTRTIEPHYLYYNLPVWYVLAWDRLRDDVRFFRIDRIERVRSLGSAFRRRRAEVFIEAGEPEARTI